MAAMMRAADSEAAAARFGQVSAWRGATRLVRAAHSNRPPHRAAIISDQRSARACVQCAHGTPTAPPTCIFVFIFVRPQLVKDAFGAFSKLKFEDNQAAMEGPLVRLDLLLRDGLPLGAALVSGPRRGRVCARLVRLAGRVPFFCLLMCP